MRRWLCLSVAALLGSTVHAGAANFLCWNKGIHCIVPPPPPCPDCRCPCDSHWRIGPLLGAQHTQHLMDQLSQSDCCCDRITAARKLGSRMHANFCCEPEVLAVLAHALLCDPCWEVRQAAAWSIALQQARTDAGVLALYVASKLDPHYLVRDKATDALDVLIVCRRECFKEVLAAGDALVKKYKGKHKPGSPDCHLLFMECGAGSSVLSGSPLAEGETPRPEGAVVDLAPTTPVRDK